MSISLPFIPTMDIVRAHVGGGTVVQGDDFTQVRVSGFGVIYSLFIFQFGIWSACWYNPDGERTCLPNGHAYQVAFANSDRSASVIIGSSWTRGLAIHPVACVVTFIALLMSFSTHITVTLIASLTAFLAALLTLIAFAVDIALFGIVHHELGELVNVTENTNTAPGKAPLNPKRFVFFLTLCLLGFWLTFASLILLLLGACTVCFGRRRDRMAGSSYPSYPMSTTKSGGFLSRFRRN